VVERTAFLALVGIAIIAVLIFSGALNLQKLTGLAVFEQGSDCTGFDEGVYSDVECATGTISLSVDQVSGTYTSKVFDATDDSVWNDITWAGASPSSNYLYGVDGAGDVYKSSDGATWTQTVDNYGRGSVTQGMFSDDNYIYIVAGGAREVWRSSDGGTWNVVNDSFNEDLKEGDVDLNGKLYVLGGTGTVWQSTDAGVTWTAKGDFNAGISNDAMGICVDSNNVIYVADGSRSVYASSDEGSTWERKTDDYGGGDPDDIACLGTDLHILRDKESWRSTDAGVTWTDINSAALSDADLRLHAGSDNILYALDVKGRSYNSSDGITWTQIGDMNPGDNDPKGLTEFSETTSLSIQVRSCDDASCSGETWSDVSGASPQDLSVADNRYFQYRVDFATPDAGTSPSLESISLDYDLINQAPLVTLVSPQDGANYGYNESLALDFVATDINDNLDSCWYTVNAGADIALPSCDNITFDIAEGIHAIDVYVNDTFGEEATDSASFTVAVGAPSIILSSPIDTYSQSGETTFAYVPTDLDLEVCELWGDFTGAFEKSQTDASPSSGSENTFDQTLGEGEYSWNIWCNDTQGNEAFNGNKTFSIDSTAPGISISEPAGAKTSRTSIPLEFSVTDASPTTCVYNVMQGASEEVSNTTVVCSESAALDVSTDADFVLNLYVNDSAGNSGSSSKEFSVSTASTPAAPAASSPGGGGGSVSYSPSRPRLNISGVEVIAYPNEEKTIQISVKNIGVATANKCKIKAVGDYADRIVSDDLKNIGGGEITEFAFTLNVLGPDPNVSIECIELTEQIPLSLIIIKPELDVTILEMELLSETELLVRYSVESVAASDIIFRIVDSGGNVIVENTVGFEPGDDVAEREFTIVLPEIEPGILSVTISAPNSEEPSAENTIVYDATLIGTGFVAQELLSGNGLLMAVILVVFIVLAIIIIVSILRRKKKKS